MQEIEHEKDAVHATAAYDAEALDKPVKVNFWRSTLVQCIIVGMAGFLAPGAYAALAATGAGGLADVNIGNASTAIAYALIVPSALVATGCLSKIGPRWTLVIGASGYCFFAAAMYTNSAFANQWFLILGAVICGATSGLFWVAEGVIVMVYSEPDRKGRHLAVWQSLYQLATIVGGAINLALNIDLAKRGGLRPKTYLVFVGLTCVAPLVSALVSQPGKVQRKDGRPVPAMPNEGFRKEFWLTVAELKAPNIIAGCFLWSQCLFIPSFLGTYLAYHFSVRSRALKSLIQPISTILIYQVMGRFLDMKSVALRKRVVGAWLFVQTLAFATIVWLVVQCYRFESGANNAVYDWKDAGFGAVFAPVVIASAIQGVSYGFNYYMVSYTFPKEADGIRVSRIIATLRSAESGSAAVAFGINSVHTKLSTTAILNLVFLVITLFCGAYVARWIYKKDLEGEFDERQEVVTGLETLTVVPSRS